MQDTRRQVVIALRWLPLILIGALAAGALAYTFMSAQPKVYESTATLVVSPGAAPSVQDVDLAGSAAVRYADQAVSRSVAEAVIDELGLAESTESLLKRISTATTEDTLELAISARDDEPEAARVLALSFGNEMVQRVRSTLITSEVRTADRNIESNKRLIRNLSTRYQFLQRKPNKTALDRGEMISLAGQMSALQGDNHRVPPILDSLRPELASNGSSDPQVPTEADGARPALLDSARDGRGRHAGCRHGVRAGVPAPPQQGAPSATWRLPPACQPWVRF